MRALHRVAIHAAGVILFALHGCTSVLGIHHADLDDSVGAATGGTGTGSSSGTGSSADAGTCNLTATQCAPCLQMNCGSVMASCMADSACRRSLNSYTGCLGSSCMDDTGRCAEAMTGMGQDVANCMLDHCAPSCTKGGLVDKCRLYCECMKTLCTNDFLSPSLGGDIDSCVTSCTTLKDRDQDCRWQHCEYARIDAAFHCPHAIAIPKDVCLEGLNSPKYSGVCLDKGESGFPCSTDTDCCSGNCLGSICE